MAHILKRSLFIGLGGTGAQALLQTKKRFLDTYGQIPPMIGFLVIDTDVSTGSKNIPRDNVLREHQNTNDKVSFLPSEIIHIGVQGAAAAYNLNKDTIFDWMPQENEYALRNLWQGAGQVRTNGRFGTYFNQATIMHAVQKKIADIQNINIANQTEFTPKDSGIEISFVFSIAGGTGSGTFIDIVYLVKEALKGNNNVTNIGFAVLPDVFNAMQQGVSMANTRPNSYGALMDLDFLMSKDIPSYGLTINLNNQIIPIQTNPFDILFTIGNKNTSGAVVNHISDIAEQIGLAMFTGASELSANMNSVYDNIITILSGGALDVLNKRAWACGMGMSELYYDGNTLGNIFARRVYESIINNLLSPDAEAQRLANLFIDNPEVNIRENNGNDNLINALLNKTPSNLFPHVDDVSDLKNQITAYLNSVENSAEITIKEVENEKFKEVCKHLKDFITKELNSEHGVGNVKDFLIDLDNQLKIFFKEMDEEHQEYSKEKANLETALDSDIIHLQSSSKGLASFLKKSSIRESKESLSELVNRQASNLHEIKRRVYAKQFLNKLIEEVSGYKNKIETITSKLTGVKEIATSFVNNMVNATNEKQKTFVIDLHKEDIGNTYASKDDYFLPDFIASFRKTLHNGILAFEELNLESIENIFWKYCKKLPKAQSFKNKSIDDILRDLPEDKTKEIANKLIAKSHALWQHSSKGYTVGKQIFDYFIIGLPSKNSNFKNSFSSLIQNQNIDYVSTGIHNKVICYRMEAASPIYGVLDVEGYAKDHDKVSENTSAMVYNIDKNWLTKMHRTNFSMWPVRQEDNSLQAWVLAFGYGFIRLDDKKNIYKIYSPNQGDALDGYWYNLSEYRDEAFDLFKRGKFTDELIQSIESKQSKDGESISSNLIQDVKKNYVTNYAQINLSREDLEKPIFQKVADLLRKEIDFVTKELN